MPSILKRFLPFLALMAVGYAQVFGMAQGYICNHLDGAVEMAAEHCHRSPVESQAPFVPCDGSGDESKHSEKDTEHHTPLTKEFKVSVVANVAVAPPVFIPMLVMDLPSFELEAILLTREAEISVNGSPPLERGSGLLHYEVQVAKCMVLLV